MGYQNQRIWPLVVVLLAGASLFNLPQAALGKGVAVSSPSLGDCVRTSGKAKSAPALSEAIKFSPKPTQEQVVFNFGTDRQLQAVTLVFFADKPLPTSVKPANLEMIADPMFRSDERLESERFPRPTFSQPRIQNNRSRVEVDVCLNPAEVKPGKYTTTITLGGPVGINSATVALTANLKAGLSFWIMWAIVIALSLAILVFQESQADVSGRKRYDRVFKWTTGVSLVGVAIVIWGIWDSDPTWGANTIAALVALGGAAFASIGVKSTTETITRKSKSS
ncbi:MAG: hypothetical protein JHC87_02415 [Thermoleophilaceae bacterium]|nr:hypothetical protein [Thermoleophilaceae bacterium]